VSILSQAFKNTKAIEASAEILWKKPFSCCIENNSHQTRMLIDLLYLFIFVFDCFKIYIENYLSIGAECGKQNEEYRIPDGL